MSEDNRQSPTIQELAAACADVLPADDCWEIAGMTMDEETLGYVFTLLIAGGVEDPEQFLIQKGILEPTRISPRLIVRIARMILIVAVAGVALYVVVRMAKWLLEREP
jgi:hypothetical protein